MDETEFDQRRPEELEPQPPVEVPIEALSPHALDSLIESYILREGTDYGAQEAAFETKIDQIRKQLKNEGIRIVFDPNSETVTLMTDRDWQRLATRLR